MSIRMEYIVAANKTSCPTDSSSRTISTTNLQIGDIIRLRGKTPKQDKDYVVMNLVGTNSPDNYDVLALPHGRNFQQILQENNQVLLGQEHTEHGVEVVGYIDIERLITNLTTKNTLN